jgi:Na+/phosphate symporter
MMEDPRNISFCIHLMFCAKNIERIGDHATNIAETVFYMIEGQQIMDKRPKGDMTTVCHDRYPKLVCVFERKQTGSRQEHPSNERLTR